MGAEESKPDHQRHGLEAWRRRRVLLGGLHVPVAQFVRVGSNLLTREVLRPVAVARTQRIRLGLPVQDGQAVVAASAALLPVEHGAAVAVIITQGCTALWLGFADPEGHAARYLSSRRRETLHFCPAHFHVALALLANVRVSAAAVGQFPTFLGGR